MGVKLSQTKAERNAEINKAIEHSETTHAPADAEKNVIVGIQKNGVDVAVGSNRKSNITVPTKLSELTNDKNFITASGNAGTATKWATARNINGMTVDGTANRTNYGTCSTAADTAAKTVDCAGFTLIKGAEITVKFTNTNSAAQPTLNVNNQGAKAIYYRGDIIPPTCLAKGRVYTFRYDGKNYELVGDINADTNTDTKNTAGSTDTSSKIFLIGATSQAANPQTYSHDTAYVGTDGCLYSGGTKVSVNGHTHGVATTTSSGFLSSTDKSKLDNLQVGGRNLYTQNTTLSNLSTYSTIKRDTDINGFIVTCNSDGDAHPRIKNIIEGKTWYTVSAYIKADTSCTMAWDVCDYSLGSIKITTEYQYFKGTVYNPRSDSPVYNFVDIEVIAQGANNKLYFKNFKVEKGTMATDWTPAPEDADSLYSSIDHTHTKSQITDFPTSLKNPNGLRVQVNGDGASEVRYDGSEAKTINFVAGDNVTLTQKTSENKVTIAAKDTHYTSKNVVGSSASATSNTTTALTNGNVYLNSVENGSVTSSHNIKGIGGTTVSTDTSGNIVIKAPTSSGGTASSLENALTVKANGTQLYTYDGSAAKTINIKAGSNVTITSDSSGNITISSTASAGSVTGDVGEVLYEATSGGLYCDGKTYATKDNSFEIRDPNPNGYYKRFRFYCQGYYGLVCVDMPLDREHPAYITTNGTRYGGVIFPTAENGNINNNTGIGPSSHMYYELKWRVIRDLPVWKVQVIDSGWLGLNAGKTTNANYAGNASTSDAGTGYVSWNQRHNNTYCIYKIVGYTD